MQPSSQNIPRGGIYPFQKINRKFDFRSACNKIPKTTAFTCILTLILGISYIKSHFFCIWVEFTFSKWNLILQSGIYFFNSPKFLKALETHFRDICPAFLCQKSEQMSCLTGSGYQLQPSITKRNSISSSPLIS